MTDKVNLVRNPSRALPDSFLKANKQLKKRVIYDLVNSFGYILASLVFLGSESKR